jgi:thymidylate synthase
MGLGVPFNIASYALLTRLLAQVAGLRVRSKVMRALCDPTPRPPSAHYAHCALRLGSEKRCHPSHSQALLRAPRSAPSAAQAGEFVHVLGDAHIYRNHVEPLLLQLEREPRPFPRLRIDPAVTSIDDFRLEHLTLEGYDPWGTIKMEMAV